MQQNQEKRSERKERNHFSNIQTQIGKEMIHTHKDFIKYQEISLISEKIYRRDIIRISKSKIFKKSDKSYLWYCGL